MGWEEEEEEEEPALNLTTSNKCWGNKRKTKLVLPRCCYYHFVQRCSFKNLLFCVCSCRFLQLFIVSRLRFTTNTEIVEHIEKLANAITLFDFVKQRLKTVVMITLGEHELCFCCGLQHLVSMCSPSIANSNVNKSCTHQVL